MQKVKSSAVRAVLLFDLQTVISLENPLYMTAARHGRPLTTISIISPVKTNPHAIEASLLILSVSFKAVRIIS
jgi:hypothetical protein